MAAGFAEPRCMGPPRVIDPAHSNLKALIGSLPKVRGEQAGVSPHLASSSNPPVADWIKMVPSKLPTDKAVALRYQAKMGELRDQRAGIAA
eukprot:13768589-Alexandrium_andersonii.AAC.1